MTHLPPGRELDARIASKVMEWTLDDSQKLSERWITPDGARYTNSPYDMFHRLLPLFEPSTDIADAWLVLEKMRAQLPGQEVMLYYCDGWAVGSLCQAGGTIEIGDDYAIGDARTAPHAICLAALEVMK